MDTTSCVFQERRWTNVHKGSKEDGFWKHEYEKHGSCALSIPQLDKQVKK